MRRGGRQAIRHTVELDLGPRPPGFDVRQQPDHQVGAGRALGRHTQDRRQAQQKLHRIRHSWLRAGSAKARRPPEITRSASARARISQVLHRHKARRACSLTLRPLHASEQASEQALADRIRPRQAAHQRHAPRRPDVRQPGRALPVGRQGFQGPGHGFRRRHPALQRQGRRGGARQQQRPPPACGQFIAQHVTRQTDQQLGFIGKPHRGNTGTQRCFERRPHGSANGARQRVGVRGLESRSRGLQARDDDDGLRRQAVARQLNVGPAPLQRIAARGRRPARAQLDAPDGHRGGRHDHTAWEGGSGWAGAAHPCVPGIRTRRPFKPTTTGTSRTPKPGNPDNSGTRPVRNAFTAPLTE